MINMPILLVSGDRRCPLQKFLLVGMRGESGKLRDVGLDAHREDLFPGLSLRRPREMIIQDLVDIALAGEKLLEQCPGCILNPDYLLRARNLAEELGSAIVKLSNDEVERRALLQRRNERAVDLQNILTEIRRIGRLAFADDP